MMNDVIVAISTALGKGAISIIRLSGEGSIELVNKSLSKSKALTLFMNKFGIKDAIRITEDNFSTKKGIRYIPIYAVFCLSDTI